MSTTYKIRYNKCNCCNRYDEKELGISASGWYFKLRVYPELKLNTLNDWIDFIHTDETIDIVDEYGEEITIKSKKP